MECGFGGRRYECVGVEIGNGNGKGSGGKVVWFVVYGNYKQEH